MALRFFSEGRSKRQKFETGHFSAHTDKFSTAKADWVSDWLRMNNDEVTLCLNEKACRVPNWDEVYRGWADLSEADKKHYFDKPEGIEEQIAAITASKQQHAGIFHQDLGNLNGDDRVLVLEVLNKEMTVKQQMLFAFIRKQLGAPAEVLTDDVIKKYLHQGALLNATGGALVTLAGECGSRTEERGIESIDGQEKKVPIYKDEQYIPAQGRRQFSLSYKDETLFAQEVIEIPYVTVNIQYTNQNDEFIDSSRIEIVPDNEAKKPYVIRAETTLAISLKDPENTQTQVLSAHIDYGSGEVRQIFDRRNFLEVFVDWVKGVFGKNRVEVLTPDPGIEPDEPKGSQGPTSL